jgi:Holliday junction DNA helicase RuvB
MVEPPTINHFLGQRNVVARFKVALEAAWADGTRLPHMLMVGPPGTGKTLLAHLAAREMGVAIHERLAQVIDCMGTLNGLLMKAQNRELCFFDEIHAMPPDVQTALYRAMEGHRITIRGQRQSTMTLPIRDVTVIGATTDEFRLLGPLRDRFKLVLPFEFYDHSSLTTIVSQRAQLMGIDIDEGVLSQIAMRGKGTPRLAIRLLEACHRFTRSVGADQVTDEHFRETVMLEGIDELGLGPDEQRYLRFLARRNGDPTRLTTSEAALGIHARTIQQVVEPFLVRSGLVERHAAGRIITEKGMSHIERSLDREGAAA